MKRIISSILVIVMLALSLASCGYNLADDDMTDYATFSDAEMAAFVAALKNILVEDGDFTTDDAIREQRVMDSIYAAIADATAADSDKLTEGKPDNRDLIYYSYYMTADFDGVTAVFYPAKMKSSSAVTIQLRGDGDYGDDELSEKIAALLKAHDFKDMSYVSTNSGTTFEGDIAYVTYTETVGDKEPVVHTNEKIVIGASKGDAEVAPSFESHLCGVTINSSVAEYLSTDSDGNKVTYSSIKVNFVINRTKSGNTAEGDKAFVTYTKQVGDGKAETVTNELIVVGKAPAEGTSAATLPELISGKKIGSKLVNDDENKTEIKLEVTEGETKTVYSAITVNWVQNDGKPLGTVTDAPFDEETLVKDVVGEERNLEGKEITYYIYPVNYVDVPDYTAELLVEKIILADLASSSTDSTTEELAEAAAKELCKMIFADRYAALAFDEDATSEEMDELLAELVKDANEKYSKKNAKDEDVNFAKAVELVVAYYKDIADAETSKQTASDRLTEAQTAYDEAERKLEEAKGAETPDADLIKELEDALKKADEALNGKVGEDGKKTGGAKADVESAEAEYDAIELAKENNIKFLLEMTADEVALSTTFTNGYKIVNYYYLQYSYNEEIRTKLAEEIYFFITENVKMNADGDLPSEIVDDAYTKLYETYENTFYTGNYDSSESNYKHYNGSFSAFLVAKVTEDIKTVKTLDEAKAAMEEKAEEIAVPIVQVFLFADAYDMTISSGDYEDYKDEIEDYYYSIYGVRDFDVEEIYGENSLKMAAQLDKILDWLLEYEETEEKVGLYTKKAYKYTCKDISVGFEIGEPASKADAPETEE